MSCPMPDREAPVTMYPRMFPSFALLAGLLAMGQAAAGTETTPERTVRQKAAAQATAPSLKRYIYVLHLVPRLHDAKDWTAADNATVDAHFLRLQQAAKAGKVILAGRTAEPLAQSFGIVIFEADSDAAALAFMQGDPTIRDGVMTAELHPFSLALQRP